jgi:hypothetical protein
MTIHIIIDSSGTKKLYNVATVGMVGVPKPLFIQNTGHIPQFSEN